MTSIVPDLVREARRRAGLSQRGLARRAGTTQSVVARVESGHTSPTWQTLIRLLAAAGFDLDAVIAPSPTPASHMLADVPRILALTPEHRLAEVANFSRFTAAVRRA